MSEYVKESLSKGDRADAAAKDVLMQSEAGRGVHEGAPLRHGDWIRNARKDLKSNMFSNPSFALLLMFFILSSGSVYLFENMQDW